MRCQRNGARRVGVDVEDFACGTVGVQVCNRGSSGAAFVQEDERDVVRLALLCQRSSMIILCFWVFRRGISEGDHEFRGLKRG